MKRPWLLIALLLSVGVNIGILATLGVARARGPRPMRGEFEQAQADRGPRTERLAEWLRLEGDERAEFLDQHQRFFERLQSTREGLMRTRRELRIEVGSPEPDSERIDELLTESARLMAELDRAFVDNVLATRQILDPRQQRAYFGLLSRLRDRGDRSERGDRGERGRRGPGDRPPGPGPGPPF